MDSIVTVKPTFYAKHPPLAPCLLASLLLLGLEHGLGRLLCGLGQAPGQRFRRLCLGLDALCDWGLSGAALVAQASARARIESPREKLAVPRVFPREFSVFHLHALRRQPNQCLGSGHHPVDAADSGGRAERALLA